MVSSSDVYFYVLLFLVHFHDVITDPNAEHCCCDEKKVVNVFSLPGERIELRKKFNYTDSSEDIFRKIGNDSDIIRTAETLDKGYYTSLCWSEIITLNENRNGTNTVAKEYAITFETKSDIPDKYIKNESTNISHEYKQYQIYDQATKKSEIVNFTTISKTDDNTVRQSRKMFCGSGPIYTKEFTNWAQSDRNRVEIKVSPKKQNLVANNIATLHHERSFNAAVVSKESKHPDAIRNYNKPDSTNYVHTARVINTHGTTPNFFIQSRPQVFRKVTPNIFTDVTSHSSFTIGGKPGNIQSSKTSFITLPKMMYASKAITKPFRPNYGLSSNSRKGKVKIITSNPNLADDNHTDNVRPTLKSHTFHFVTPTINTYSPSEILPQKHTASPKEEDIIVSSRTITEILPSSDTNFSDFSTTSINSEQTSSDVVPSTSNSISTVSTTPASEYDDDSSDELGDIRKDSTKSTECSTTDVTEKLTTIHKDAFTTHRPDAVDNYEQITVKKHLPKGVVDSGGSANRIAFEYNPISRKSDIVKNGTEIIQHQKNKNNPSIQCELPKQKIVLNLKLSVDYNIESNDPSNYYYYSFPIMEAEKNPEFPLNFIDNVPSMPVEILEYQFNNILNDLSNVFYDINNGHIFNYTLVVNQILNLTTPDSDIDYQIIPEEMLERLQGIGDYLQLCEILKNQQVSDLNVTPQFRFSGAMRRAESITPMNLQNYGHFNYLYSPQQASSNNYPIPYIKNYQEPSFGHSLKLIRPDNYRDVPNKSPQHLKKNNWVNINPLSSSSTPSSFYTRQFQWYQNGPTLEKHSSEKCPGCKISTLDEILSRLQSYLQSENL